LKYIRIDPRTPEDKAIWEGQFRALENEALIGAKLNEHKIKGVPHYHTGLHQALLYGVMQKPTPIIGFVMDHIDGYSVYVFWKKRNKVPFTEPDALQIFRKTTTILSSLHDVHIYHGDIKHENIILDKYNDNVTLVDFGFSTESEYGLGRSPGYTPGF